MPCQLRFSCHISRVDLSESLTSESHQSAQPPGSLMQGWPLNYSTHITLEECLWGLRFKEGDNVSANIFIEPVHSKSWSQNTYCMYAWKEERFWKEIGSEGGSKLSFRALVLKISILVSCKKSDLITEGGTRLPLSSLLLLSGWCIFHGLMGDEYVIFILALVKSILLKY